MTRVNARPSVYVRWCVGEPLDWVAQYGKKGKGREEGRESGRKYISAIAVLYGCCEWMYVVMGGVTMVFGCFSLISFAGRLLQQRRVLS